MIKNMPYKYRDYSHLAAEASLAAGDQSKYWEMHDLLLERGAKLDRDGLVQMAAKLGLDVKRFAADLDTMKHKDLLERDKALAVSINLYETPTYFINGRKVVGNRDFEYLSKVIDEELASLGKFAVVRAVGVMPEGTPFAIPEDQPPPPPLDAITTPSPATTASVRIPATT